jgi:hypothetical protein
MEVTLKQKVAFSFGMYAVLTTVHQVADSDSGDVATPATYTPLGEPDVEIENIVHCATKATIYEEDLLPVTIKLITQRARDLADKHFEAYVEEELNIEDTLEDDEDFDFDASLDIDEDMPMDILDEVDDED